MSTVHQLKTDPGVFQLSWEGKKPWEIRFDDRDYYEGDRLILLETKYFGEEMADGKPLEYTGRQIQARVTAVVEGYGLEKGWVILSVEIESRYAPVTYSLDAVLKAAAPNEIAEALCDSKLEWNGPLYGLPPIGMICEIAEGNEYLTISYQAGTEVKIYAHFTDDRGVELAAFVDAHGKVGGVATSKCFRPIRTERDKCIEAMASCMCGANSTSWDVLAEALYDSDLFDISLREGA